MWVRVAPNKLQVNPNHNPKIPHGHSSLVGWTWGLGLWLMLQLLLGLVSCQVRFRVIVRVRLQG